MGAGAGHLTGTPGAPGDADPAPGRPGRPAVVAVAAAAVVALVAAGTRAVAAGATLSFSDERDYLTFARNLADGRGFTRDGVTPSAYRPPVWPFVLSLGERLGFGVVGLRLIGVVCLAGGVVVVGALAGRIAGPVAAAVAAALMATSPLLAYTAGTLYPETLALLLVASLLLVVVVAAERTGAGAVALAGVAGGCWSLVALTSPGYAVVGAPALVWLTWRAATRHGARAALVPAAVMLVAAVSGPVAWGLRNRAALGAFVPVSTNGGVNLLLGNSPGTTPSSGVRVDLSEAFGEVERRGLDEVETDRFLREEALRWMREHPGRAARLYVGKFAHFFAYANELASGARPGRAARLVGALSFYPLLGAFLARLVLARRWPLRRGEGLCVAAYFGYALVVALFFTRVRFRVPVEPLMMVVVAAGLATAWRARSRSAAATDRARSTAASSSRTDRDGTGVASVSR